MHLNCSSSEDQPIALCYGLQLTVMFGTQGLAENAMTRRLIINP